VVRHFRESPELSATQDASADLTLTKKLDCNNLVFATHIMVSKKAAIEDFSGHIVEADFAKFGNHASKYVPIENITVSGTSRELVNTSGFELLNVDQENYGRESDVMTSVHQHQNNANHLIETDQKDCIHDPLGPGRFPYIVQWCVIS